MAQKSPAFAEPPEGYSEWLAELKSRLYAAQQRAALAVNNEMLRLYWQIGQDILARQGAQGWGRKITERLSHDLRTAFPDMKGFSRTNLDYMRAFAEAWPEEAISQQAVGKLPWGHNLVLLTKLKSADERLNYAETAARHGWSRKVLTIQIERRVLDRQGKAITNFDTTIPAPDTDLARESLKDPYRLDFLGLREEAEERAVEDALIEHVAEFLLELGAGFAFVGRQVHLEVGGDDFWLDLLFYQVKLHRYVVIELKAEKFKPERLGQLGFYMTAVDRQLRDPTTDGNTIGLLLCKGKNEVVAEYALEDNSKPLGIAEYRLVKSLPESLQTALPTIEQLERELGTSD
jgi:predicted nuclease of restriction endonuclease-like (RecB) superfamily